MIQRYRKKLTTFLILSLLIHFGAWLAVVLSRSVKPPKVQEQVEIEILEPPQPRPVARVKEAHPQQIVEQEERLNNQKDPNARFLSKNDQTVTKQTRAAQSGRFKNAEGERSKPKPQPIAKPAPDNQEKDPTLAALKPDFSVKPPPTEEVDESDAKPGEASATDDYLKDVEVGMQTMLSTREFVYYSYYQRIKDRIRQHWEPKIKENVKIIYRQGRSLASAHDHVTQVLITLNNQGELEKVDIVTPSGLQPLDDAAVDAFRSAQPFPNPPKGLIEADGKIRIRWDFVLEASSSNPVNNFDNYAQGSGHATRPARRR